MASPGLEQVMRYTGAAGEFLENVVFYEDCVRPLLASLRWACRGVVKHSLDRRGHSPLRGPCIAGNKINDDCICLFLSF